MEEPNITVGIKEDKTVDFELHGDYKLSPEGAVYSGKISVYSEDGNLVIEPANGSAFRKEESVEFVPVNYHSATFLLKDVTIGIDFHWERKEDQQFRGTIKLILDKGRINAINILRLEDYLLSVISSEMSASSTAEFLKAHAVISRSWLLAQIEKRISTDQLDFSYENKEERDGELIKWYDRDDHYLFDVCADDHCQRYQGITKASTENARLAVEETRGMFLNYDGEICDARFSKCCGGISERYENVWDNISKPYLRSIIDNDTEPKEYNLDLTESDAAENWIKNRPPAYCNTDDQAILSQVLLDYDKETKDFFRWRVEYTQSELSSLIRARTDIDFGDIQALIPIERGPSGRLVKLKIMGTIRSLIIGKELEIRKALSESHLYSSAFVVDTEEEVDGIPGKFILTGAGWGHGVGLCQIGAAVMGSSGYTYDKILKHYFSGVNITKYYG